MAYVPINTQAFTAAAAGAIAGMGVSGPIVDPTAGDYAPVWNVVGAFAQAFDTAWNSATDLTALEYAAISTVCQQEFANRGPGPLSNAQFQLASNWIVQARACVAIVREGDAYFGGQGITPAAPCFCSGGSAPNFQTASTVNDLLLVGYADSEPDTTLTGAWNLLQVTQGDEVAGLVRVLVDGASEGDVLEIQNDPNSAGSFQIRQGPGGSIVLVTSLLGGDVAKLVFDGTNWLPWGVTPAAT
jgi:hypothetical protein